MACPLYCILSAGTVHCIPVATFTSVQETPPKLTRLPAISTVADPSAPGRSMAAAPELPSLAKTRNLLYTLNNPSLSDLDSEPSRRFSETSFNDDDTQDDSRDFEQESKLKEGSRLREQSGWILEDNSELEAKAPTEKVYSKAPTKKVLDSKAPSKKVLDSKAPNKKVLDSRNDATFSFMDSDPENTAQAHLKSKKAPFSHLSDPQWGRAGPDSDTEPSAAQDMPIGASAAPSEKPDIQAILNDYSTHAVYLPQYSVDLQGNLDTDFSQIRGFLPKIFPAWQGPISIRQLTGGITNMLLSCSHDPSADADPSGSNGPTTSQAETLLMRVYGKGTNLIIDRNREFVSHLTLNSLKLAPPIHARFANGLIYGFLPGRSLEPHEMSHPYLYPLIAQQLGHWHNKINCEYIEDGIHSLRKHTVSMKRRVAQPPATSASEHSKKSVNNLWDLLEEWISIVPINDALVRNFAVNLKDSASQRGNQPVSSENIRRVILDELRWVRKTLKTATRSEMVVCHCDLLSGNIIIPETEEFKQQMQAEAKLPRVEENPIQFIDYEYMIPAPRAFDIANHFAEWQGFDCNREAIPKPSVDNPIMVQWCRGYLNNDNATDESVTALIEEIACYYGLPGFYWGIWAMIQSELSIIDFNYAEYSLLRLEEYWMWKQQFSGG